MPRNAWLTALAIRFERLFLRAGIVSDQSELARLAEVTQPRMTPILSRLHLAPDIQKELLFRPRLTRGKDPVHERMLRPIAAEMSWESRREMWAIERHRFAGT